MQFVWPNWRQGVYHNGNNNTNNHNNNSSSLASSDLNAKSANNSEENSSGSLNFQVVETHTTTKESLYSHSSSDLLLADVLYRILSHTKPET